MKLLVWLVIIIVSTILHRITKGVNKDLGEEKERKKLEQAKREQEAYEQSQERKRKREAERLKNQDVS